jgi:hypothetical protein
MRAFLSIAAVIFLAALIAGEANAQAELKPTIGLTYSNVSKSPVNGVVASQPGWQVGASLLAGDHMYIEPGVYYATKSTSFTNRLTNREIANDLNGFRVPVALGLHLLGAETNPVAVRVFGGASMFIVTSVNAPGVTLDDFTSPSWGVFAGAGLDVAMFFVDVQYEWSLSEVSKLSTIDVGSSRSLFVNAGLRLPF